MSTLAPPRPPAAPSTAPGLPRDRDWWVRLPWRSPEAKAAPRDDLATLCSFLVTLAVALSVGRLFKGTTWLPYGAAAAALAHLFAWAFRRLGAGLTVASLASPLFSLIVAIELVVRQATTYGFPTPFTFQVMGQALTDAQSDFPSAVPPVAPTSGFLTASVVGVCMTAFLADWAAFRMRTAFEACAPALALFVFAAVLGAKSHRGLAVASFAAAALVFLIVQRANLDATQTAWFGGRDRGALPSLLATGGVLGAVAVIGALVVSPVVPGAASQPLVSLKKGAGGSGGGSGGRSTVSPLVDIQTRLREYANVDVFTVRSDRPAYWRLTSLDQFNGTIWSSNERYAATRGELERSGGAGSTLLQQITVSSLSSIWLPAAYRPTSVDGMKGLAYSPGSASLVSKQDTSNGLTYTITSELPEPEAQDLRRAPQSAIGRSGLGADFERYIKVGGPVTPRVSALASQLGEGEPTTYGKALALQKFLRSARFTYNLSAASGHSGNALDRFLFDSRSGYCEQFAGAFALLARVLGIPTRVAVGFQPGTERNGTFTVKDKDAHAWPEVYLEGIGWTAFEPTPSAANPQAQGYTGVPYTPAAPSVSDPREPTTPPTTAPVAGPEQPTATTEALPQPPPDVPASEAAQPPNHRWAGVLAALRRAAPIIGGLAVLAGLVGGSAAFVAWDRRSRRRQVAGSAEARVQLAWEESMQALALAGVRHRPAETINELLDRLGRPDAGAAQAGVAEGDGRTALLRLGGTVAQTAYTGRDAPVALADEADADRATIGQACRGSLGRWSRLRVDLDPRPGLARLRSRPRPARRPA